MLKVYMYPDINTTGLDYAASSKMEEYDQPYCVCGHHLEWELKVVGGEVIEQ